MKPIELDGRTGEGGGQLVRVAIGLAALTSQSVKITNVRGNRPRGGLGSQHVTSIRWLADATDAEVDGLSVGSRTLCFAPRRPPTELLQRNIKITAESGAASTLLVLQAILPFLLFAGNDGDEPLFVQISGGTNVSFSLSFEYLDQVLLPTLDERFGIKIERKLERRGWSEGTQSRGSISLKMFPFKPGEQLKYRHPAPYLYPDSHRVRAVDVSILVPTHSHEKLQAHIVSDLDTLFPDADVHFKVTDDSSNDARWYVLLVAHSVAGIRWGKDILTSLPKKAKSRDAFVSSVSRKICRELYDEVLTAGQVDDHLQDQIICFQALCEGLSSLPRGEHRGESDATATQSDELGNLIPGAGRLRRERTHGPFGRGSLHAQTARWVVSELLPGVEFYNKGDVVKGVGTCFAHKE